MTEQVKNPVFQGRIIRVDVERVVLPNGHEMTMELIRHPGGAAVVAVDAQHRVCLLRHYRKAVDDWLWELPAGKIDHGEPPLQTAQRELAEEAGYHARAWDSLGYMVSSPGVFTERVFLYLARELEEVGSRPEEDEVFEVVWVPLVEAVQRAARGDIVDAKSVIGLLRARTLLEARHD